jgi:hypothetical protein
LNCAARLSQNVLAPQRTGYRSTGDPDFDELKEFCSDGSSCCIKGDCIQQYAIREESSAPTASVTVSVKSEVPANMPPAPPPTTKPASSDDITELTKQHALAIQAGLRPNNVSSSKPLHACTSGRAKATLEDTVTMHTDGER